MSSSQDSDFEVGLDEGVERLGAQGMVEPEQFILDDSKEGGGDDEVAEVKMLKM